MQQLIIFNAYYTSLMQSKINFSVKIPYFNLPIKAIMKLANMAELRNLFFYGKDLLIMNLSAGNLHLTGLQRN